MVKIKIDVSKIDKTKLFRGAKGVYLDCTLIETTNNQYGDDYMVVQDVSREERLAGKKGAILGNGKIWQKRDSDPAPSARSQRPAPAAQTQSDLPVEGDGPPGGDSGVPF